MKEMTASSGKRALNEGVTEYLTQISADGLHSNVADCCYQTEVSEAKRLAAEVGDAKLQGYLSRYEMAEEIDDAIRRRGSNDQSS